MDRRSDQRAVQRIFELGVRGLNELVGTITGPYTVLIEGHPGSGKTTMASTICYHNTLMGYKCLYITVYEEKEKLYNNMERLGIHLNDAEKRGLLRFIRLPITLSINDVLEVIGKNVEEGFNVVVVDTITALLELAGSAERRALLLNYFYQLPMANKGLLVLISELPYGVERVEGGSEEFIADAVFTLKHRIENGLLVRILEIRKLRGKPYHIAELPFTISEAHGITVYVPIAPGTIPREKDVLSIPCQTLSHRIGNVHRGSLVSVFYPPETIYGKEALMILLAMAMKHKLKILVISYVSSPTALKDAVSSWLARAGLKPDFVEKLISEYMVIEGTNPYTQSLVGLAIKELELVEMVKPDVVVFHGTHVIRVEPYERYFRELYNQVLWLKQMGVGVVRITNCIDERRCAEEASIADLNLRIHRVFSNNSIDYVIHIYRRYQEPVIVTRSEMELCLDELLDYIKTHANAD